MGIDVGISALITTSGGVKVENHTFYHASQIRLRVLQRKLARAHKGSKNRRKALLRVQRQQEHIANQRRDYAHKLSYGLVKDFDLIALEDLRIRNMVRNRHLSKSIFSESRMFTSPHPPTPSPSGRRGEKRAFEVPRPEGEEFRVRAKTRFRDSLILDSGWGIFRQFLTVKAASAGRVVIAVDPAYTSKCCSNCGVLFQNFDLSTRWVDCACGLSLDRDHNAAINILQRALMRNGWDTSVTDNAAPLSNP